ncbi:MAG: Flp pilus assembly protein CpaB [bacterium]|nr:Flp pilus assembly protein CpaB [bacterium]
MNSYFGGVHPGRNQQRNKAFGLLVGIGLVVVFTFVGFLILNNDSTTATVNEPQVKEVVSQVAMVEVLVPVQSLEPGVRLEPSMFRKESRPKEGLPRKVVRDYEEIKGTFARSIIASDAPLLSDYITTTRPTSVITPEIPDGYRAATIRVDAQTAVEGWARPGARVDIVWTTQNRGKQAVITIVQNAKVLSAEQLTQGQAEETGKAFAVPSTVTLLVTAQDAKKIQLAKTSGTLSLTLRGDNDLGKSEMGGTITFDDLLGTTEKTVDEDPNIQGTIKIGGVEYKLVNGKMIPTSEMGKNRGQ